MAKKKKKSSSRFNTHKLIISLLIIAVVACIIGLLWQSHPEFFNRKYTQIRKELIEKSDSGIEMPTPSSKPVSPIKKPTENASNKKEQTDKKVAADKKGSSTDTKGSKDIRSLRDLEVPAELKDRPAQVIRHEGYVVSFNERWKVPNWVGWELTRFETSGESKRTNRFIADPKVKGKQATGADYSGSGYDRGHMAPAGDMSWSKNAMKESFYFTNMCPQAPNLNRGIWKSLEDKTRDWAVRDSALIVICGPVIGDTSHTIGAGKVLVPRQFYKVILSPYGKKVKAIGFLFDNEGSLESLDRFAVTVDSIEKLTGIDFFHQLPDSVEREVEARFSLNEWF